MAENLKRFRVHYFPEALISLYVDAADVDDAIRKSSAVVYEETQKAFDRCRDKDFEFSEDFTQDIVVDVMRDDAKDDFDYVRTEKTTWTEAEKKGLLPDYATPTETKKGDE